MAEGKDLKSSVEKVYQDLRHAILTGDFPPGMPLRLQDVAARSGVSMIPVREALRLLEVEGFVEAIPNRGARVAPLSLADMLDVYRTRIVLEVEALRQAIPHTTPAVVARARVANEELVRHFEEHGYADYEGHRAFHFTLYEPSGSWWLMHMIGIVWDHTERYRRKGAVAVRASDARAEHEAIVRCVEAGDVPGALQALTDHLEGSAQRIHQLLVDRPDLLDSDYSTGEEPSPPDAEGRRPRRGFGG